MVHTFIKYSCGRCKIRKRQQRTSHFPWKTTLLAKRKPSGTSNTSTVFQRLFNLLLSQLIYQVFTWLVQLVCHKATHNILRAWAREWILENMEFRFLNYAGLIGKKVTATETSCFIKATLVVCLIFLGSLQSSLSWTNVIHHLITHCTWSQKFSLSDLSISCLGCASICKPLTAQAKQTDFYEMVSGIIL